MKNGKPDRHNFNQAKQKMMGIRTSIATGRQIIFICFFVLIPGMGFCSETEWQHLFTQDGIEVYRKILPGTPVCAFKGIGSVDAGIDVIGSVLQDISAYPQWVARCRESVVLKEIDGNTRIFYSVIETPRPFKDRDMILSETTVYRPAEGLVEINFDIFNQEILPPREDCFRVKTFSSKYAIESLGQDKTRVTFVFSGDPGGNIPVTIANWVQSRSYPHTIIMGLREMARKRKCAMSNQPDNAINLN